MLVVWLFHMYSYAHWGTFMFSIWLKAPLLEIYLGATQTYPLPFGDTQSRRMDSNDGLILVKWLGTCFLTILLILLLG